MAMKTVKGIKRLGQYALDKVDGVDQAGKKVDLAPADDADAARHRDPRLVVAVDIRAHRQLALVLCRVEQLTNALGVLHRVAAARDRTAYRAGLDPPAVDPDIHF